MESFRENEELKKKRKPKFDISNSGYSTKVSK